MSLPAAWVDRLFAKLTLTYGQRFLGLYAGLDLQAVKDDWGATLAVFAQNPDAIRHGIENLPCDQPPNALQFRDICRRRPDAAPKALPAPKADPERLAAQLRRLGALKGSTNNPRQWAWDLMDRERRQKPKQPVTVREGLTRFQRQAWREALGLPVQMPLAECVIALGLAEREAA